MVTIMSQTIASMNQRAAHAFAPSLLMTVPPRRDRNVVELFLEHGIKATFFVLGAELERYKILCRRIVELGHELGVHGWTHRSPNLMTSKEIFISLERTVAAIETLTGVRPRFVRPCFGHSTAAFQKAAARLELTPVGWHFSGGDWAATSSHESIRDLAAAGLDGKILLFHDGAGDPEINRRTIRWLVNSLDRASFKALTISEYVGSGAQLPTL